MAGFLVLILLGYIVYLHGRIVRGGIAGAENPAFVMEKAPLPKALQSVADRLDLWKEEGRLSAEEHEKLMFLVGEDAARGAKKP